MHEPLFPAVNRTPHCQAIDKFLRWAIGTFHENSKLPAPLRGTCVVESRNPAFFVRRLGQFEVFLVTISEPSFFRPSGLSLPKTYVDVKSIGP